MSKHTPGPWKFFRPATGNGFIHIDSAERYRRGEIATCFGENNEADARLIAAAPELLQQCEDALSMCEDAISGKWEPNDDGFAVAAHYLRAVIAKATGVAS